MKRDEALAYFYLGLAVVIVIVPLTWFFEMSLESKWFTGPFGFTGGSIVYFKEAFPEWNGKTLQNYYFVLTDRALPILNTLVVSCASTVAALFLSMLAAYALARFKIRGSENVAYWLLSLRLTPSVVIVIPMFLFMRNIGLIDSPFALVLVYTMSLIPFDVWLLRGFFQEIPVELEEAAWIDGCSRWRSFVTIFVPLTGGGLIAASIFNMIFCWGEYLFALILTRTNAITIPVALYLFRSPTMMPWGPIAAMAMVATVPLFILVLAVHKYFVRGITLGAVRG